MLIKEILKCKSSEVFTVKPDERISKAIKSFSERKIGSGVVVNNSGNVVGIFTERDALRCIEENLDTKSIAVADLMTSIEKLIIASPQDDIHYVMNMMTKHRIKHIPIFENSKLVGLVSIGDVVKAQMSESKQIAKKYLDYIGDIPHPENDQY